MYAYFTLEKPPNEAQIKQLFIALDKECTGYISGPEVRMFCKLFHTQLAGEWSRVAVNHFDMFIQSLGNNLLAAYIARGHFGNFLPM